MSNIKISVIVPVYNVETYLRQCLDSVVSQTYSPLEIILVNDGSTDGSPAICEEYAGKYENVSLLHQKNAGLAAARQTGLDAATGQYIGFVDSDDWLEPDMYEQMAKAVSETQADIVFCNVYRNEDKKEQRYLKDGYYDRAAMEKEIFPRLLASFNQDKEENNIRWCNWLRLYKKELIDRHHIRFDPRFRRCQDLPFTFECTIHAESYYYLGTQYLYHNRMNYESLSKGYTKNMWGMIKPLVDYLWNVVRQYDAYNFSGQMELRSLLFAFECADNELKPNNTRTFGERIRTISGIMSDEAVRDWLKTVNCDRFNRTMKLYRFCFEKKLPLLFYWASRNRYANRLREYRQIRRVK